MTSRKTSKVRRSNQRDAEKTKDFRIVKKNLGIIRGWANDADIYTVARALYIGINSEVSRRCLSLLEKGDYNSLAKVKVSHLEYSSKWTFYLDYCAASFLKKFAGFEFQPGSDQREANCKATFYKSEDACKATNEVFSKLVLGECSPPTMFLANILARARKVIKYALGRCPSSAELQIRFGPGAVSNAKGDRTTIADKLIAYPECTRDAVGIVSRLRQNSPVWYRLLKEVHPSCVYSHKTVVDDFGDEVVVSGYVAPKLVRGNRFSMVPKTALTHRAIGVEPGQNMVWQLALGTLLTEKLKNLGIVKDLQPDVNRFMAYMSSILGVYCTVDLSAASDTIAYYLVQFLLPAAWFELLARLRSPETLIDGRWVELEKFSSMGNGYTFELETLIFYALARAIADEKGVDSEIHVFGDDIILKSELVEDLHKVLAFCGFTLNEDKTFVDVGFNESCGGDYLEGMDVRPYFLKEIPNNALEWFSLVNGIRRMGSKHDSGGDLSPEFRRAWLCALQRVPRPLRIQGPPADHDAWIHTNERGRWDLVRKRDVFINRALGVVPTKRPLHRYCELTIRTSMLLAQIGDGFPLRGSVHRLSFIRSPQGPRGIPVLI